MAIKQILNQNKRLIEIAREYLMAKNIHSSSEDIFLMKNDLHKDGMITSSNANQLRTFSLIKEPMIVESIFDEYWVSEGANVAVWCHVKFKEVKQKIPAAYKFEFIGEKIKKIDVMIYSSRLYLSNI